MTSSSPYYSSFSLDASHSLFFLFHFFGFPGHSPRLPFAAFPLLSGLNGTSMLWVVFFFFKQLLFVVNKAVQSLYYVKDKLNCLYSSKKKGKQENGIYQYVAFKLFWDHQKKKLSTIFHLSSLNIHYTSRLLWKESQFIFFHQ